jgi:small subunit ribosomal protein S3
MGRKVHPYGFRIGVIRGWQAKWYADKNYTEYLLEDLELRRAIQAKYVDAGVSRVEIDRQANKVLVTIHTARPGIVIGRGGQRVDEIRQYLERLIGKRVQLNIQEIQQAELDAYLVGRSIAEQMERRIAFRRAMKQAIFRTMQSGAKGVKIICAGRLGGTEIARTETMHQGQVPLQKLRADIDYGFTEAHTTLGRIGIKVWIYKGDILPETREKEEEVAEKPAEMVPAAVTPAIKPKAEAPEVKPEVKPVEPVAPPAVAPVEVKPVEKRRRKKVAEKAAEPAVEKAVEKVAEKVAEKVEEVPAAPKPEEKTEKPKRTVRRRKKPEDKATTVEAEGQDAAAE